MRSQDREPLIVGKVLGEKLARPATKVIGGLEVLLGVWAFTGVARVECAAVQTVAIVAMNALEIFLAREFLISAIGMVILQHLSRALFEVRCSDYPQVRFTIEAVFG